MQRSIAQRVVAASPPSARRDGSERTRRRPMRVAVALLLIAASGYGAFRYMQANSDGPLTDLIPGGVLTTGEIITESNPVWGIDNGATVELQLESPARSRYVGALLYKGELYIPCDLGYFWSRLPGMSRHILHLVYRLKSWHTDAVRNGNVVVRINGKRYPRHAVRVTDPAVITALKTDLESLAREWMAPQELGPVPTTGPRDIWFFRLDPRTTH